MKHVIFTLVLFFAAGNLFAQQGPKVDTVVTQNWNGTTWQDTIRTVNTYDANCQLTSFLLQAWNPTSSAWENFAQTIYTYGSNGLPSVELTQSWNTGTSSWDDAQRKTNTYDGSNKLLSYNLEIYFFSTWTLFAVTTYSYDVNGYTDSILTQSAFPGPLVNSALSVYTNNSDGTPSQVLEQTWQVNAWVNSLRITYTYNAGKPQTSLIEQWQTNAWVNFEYTTFTYNGSGNVSTSLNQTWSGTAWVDDSRSTYTYSTSCTLPLTLLNFTASRNNNVISLTWQTSNEVNTSHFNIQRSADGVNFTNAGNVTAKGNSALTNNYSFTDDAKKLNGDKVYYRLQMVDKDGKYTFSKIVPVTLLAYTGNIKTYPNPVKDQLYILFNMQSSSKAELRIIDATGKTLRSQHVDAAQNNSAVGVNVATLGKGVYYVVLITDNGIQKTQFVKQ